jgi:hypothetical protein
MNQEEEKMDQDIFQLSKEQLSEEQIRELVSKASKEGIHEAMFILVLNEWNRPGSSFTDYGEFTVLYGEIEKIFMHHVYDYPTTNEYVYAIIPKTRMVILLYKWGNDYQGKLQKYAKLYIFSFHEGWKSIDLY